MPKGNSYMKKFLIKNQEVIVDLEDWGKISKYKWHISNGGVSAHPTMDGNKIHLSRYIMNVNDPNILVDHINRNRFDNRKENLRLCNNSENLRNRPSTRKGKFKGVCLEKRTGRFYAQIRIYYKVKHLGTFDTEIEAAKAYNEAAKYYHGEFACLNQIEELN
jgi:hypothetical protein